jgi:hypothetical protein
MKPLNQPERRTRLWQFTLLYLLALVVPLGASYYLFSNNSLADENARLKKELDRTHQEQNQLVARFDTLTHHLQHIDAVDQRMRTESNDLVLGKLTTSNQDYLNDIAVSLSQLRVDSAQLQIPAHRQQLAKSGAEARSSGHMAEELAQAKQQIIMLQASLSRPAPAASSGGGSAPALPPPASTGAKQQIALLQDQVAFANADCLRQRALDKKTRSKERKQLLEEARTAFIKILQNPATDDLKQSIEKTLEPINVELGRPPRFFGLF